MLFNSIDFAIFLPIVFIVYWFFANRNTTSQNLILIIASYIFYGWWDWRFLSLILISTIVDYIVGRVLLKENNQSKRKLMLLTSIAVNLGLLGFFKYYNFFLDNFLAAFSLFGSDINANTLNIILPVGISFYTFQTLSYTIDVYKRKITPTKDFLAFSAFVCFFPQLVAGPIERAKRLLPQFYSQRNFEYSKAADGMRQILWGLFKKLVIADNCAVYVNMIFENPVNYSGSALFMGALFFAFQIYGDFSGYSDIAIGTAKLFGFKLMQNFNFPYFSRDIAEFWRRWHISLSTWFRDYLYIPLGGSRGGTWLSMRNIFIIFLISGLWHGANWTFVFWGLLNAIFFLPLMLFKRNRLNIDTVAKGRFLPSIRDFLNISITFFLTVLAWIFFRAKSIGDAWIYLSSIFSDSLLSIPSFGDAKANALVVIIVFLIGFMMIVEWLGRDHKYAIEHLLPKGPKLLRWSFYGFIVFLIGMYAHAEETPFIYFNF